ncbi:RNA-directed DNA polymerase from mobile element jockey-like protein [Willisornis vidua]|uniref:RNA-directed DNA polymerase from mobile element jockey-like protein n=1 Tax=Willisornis vidua TaxID=1566151 RepID=A0ABQ9DCC0_9PASS|nr:RNA-directed DNA polymerase from mobile element jockey-like protein [Willisornis vidua]
MDDRPRGSQCPDLEDRNCKLTLNLHAICCSSWIPINLWGPERIHPRILKELADVIMKPLLMIFKWSCEYREVPADWKMADVVSFFKNCKKEETGNYRSVSLTSVLSKIIEHNILGGNEKHLVDNTVIGHRQDDVMRGKSCLSNLISLYDRIIHLLDLGKPVGVISLDFRKSFDTVSHSILLDKMSSTQLDKHDT